MQTQSHLLRRALAAGVDYGLFSGLMWAYLINFGEPASDGVYQVEGCGSGLLILGAWILLIPLMEGITGYTFGKGLFGLQVVDSRGRKVSLLGALMRHSLDLIDFSAGGLVAILTVVLTPAHQRLGDLFAKTKVINDQEAKIWKSMRENVEEHKREDSRGEPAGESGGA